MLVVLIVLIVMMMVPIVLTMFSPNVVAVDPMLPVSRHVTRDPDHGVIAVPIAGPVAVIGAVADLNLDLACADCRGD